MSNIQFKDIGMNITGRWPLTCPVRSFQWTFVAHHPPSFSLLISCHLPAVLSNNGIKCTWGKHSYWHTVSMTIYRWRKIIYVEKNVNIIQKYVCDTTDCYLLDPHCSKSRYNAWQAWPLVFMSRNRMALAVLSLFFFLILQLPSCKYG